MAKKAAAKKGGDSLKVVEDVSKTLLDLMGTKAGIIVSEDKKNEAYLVNIEDKDEAGLIIGNRGRTLLALQSLIGIIIKRRLGEWKRVILNISDWREKEEERLRNLAYQAGERAKTTKEPQHLYNLTASQRRIVHMALSGDESLETVSQGEGRDRFLTITAK